jgi:hypothetical protein
MKNFIQKLLIFLSFRKKISYSTKKSFLEICSINDLDQIYFGGVNKLNKIQLENPELIKFNSYKKLIIKFFIRELYNIKFYNNIDLEKENVRLILIDHYYEKIQKDYTEFKKKHDRLYNY